MFFRDWVVRENLSIFTANIKYVILFVCLASQGWKLNMGETVSEKCIQGWLHLGKANRALVGQVKVMKRVSRTVSLVNKSRANHFGSKNMVIMATQSVAKSGAFLYFNHTQSWWILNTLVWVSIDSFSSKREDTQNVKVAFLLLSPIYLQGILTWKKPKSVCLESCHRRNFPLRTLLTSLITHNISIYPLYVGDQFQMYFPNTCHCCSLILLSNAIVRNLFKQSPPWLIIHRDLSCWIIQVYSPIQWCCIEVQ